MIKLQDVYKEYTIGDSLLEILQNINLEIKKGEFISIIGPSGSGKSTLMYMMGLLDIPTKGKVLMNDVDTSKLSDEKLSRLRNEKIGFVFQQFNLINKFTVLENILLPMLYNPHTLDYDPQIKAITLLKRFGLDHRTHSYPNKISGGEQQRAAIARALILEPEIIFADEPTGNLDTKTGETILSLLEDLNKKEKITIVIVTHEAHIAEKTKRSISIQDGKIIK